MLSLTSASSLLIIRVATRASFPQICLASRNSMDASLIKIYTGSTADPESTKWSYPVYFSSAGQNPANPASLKMPVVGDLQVTEPSAEPGTIVPVKGPVPKINKL